MSKNFKFKDVVIEKKGFLRGPFGGDLKKEIFVERSENTYKVYEQGVVLNSDKRIGRYYISEKDYLAKLYKFSVQDKDFLISCSGVNMGAIYQLKEPFERGVINQALLRIRLNNEIIDDNYFFYLFKKLISKRITSGSGDSTIPNFPALEVIKNIEFELPLLVTQKKVGKILTDLDAKIDLNNKINDNLGLVKVNYAKDNIRGNFALMGGTYAQYNLAAEQYLMKNIYEANIGVKISKKANLWVDAGIMPSHIGFESAIGKDCMNLTRSILADNSPYYEAGAKIGYTSISEKWYLAAMYLNGWQRIQKVDGNQTPAFGTQVTYKPSGKTTLNWSTYVGNEQPDSDKKWRYFNNFYGQFKVSEKTNFVAGFDIGAQQTEKGCSDYETWYSPVIIAQYKPTAKIQLAARGEYYQDKNGVIIATGTPNGFKTFGYSANFDYLVSDNAMFRIEVRSLNSKDAIFLKDNNPTESNFFITTSLAISF